MDWAFAGLTVLVGLSSFGNWRTAIYAAVFLDVARDIVRKMTPGYPILSTIIIGIVWALAFVSASATDRRELGRLFIRYPQFKSALTLIIVGILPGAAISLVRYQNGWILVLIGGISYLAPFIGILLGYLWPRFLSDIVRWVSLYVVVNSIVLIGTVLEFAEVPLAGLGGMKMEWVRNFGTDNVKLISGFYRSPDVMGLHAAHVMMFSAMLALRPKDRWKWLWWFISIWAASCLLLSGRRKMIVMPGLFLFTYVGLNWLSGRSGKRAAVASALFAVAVLAGLTVMTQLQETSDDYSRFASSIVTESVDRVSLSFSSIIQVTIEQSGWLGDGLGSATQGKQHTGIEISKSWQEDGVGRLFKELGIPGVILVLFAIWGMISSIRQSLLVVPSDAFQVRQLQIGMLSILIANGASFIVSHQAYSGDPSTVLIVGFCLGVVLGIPRLAFTRQGLN